MNTLIARGRTGAAVVRERPGVRLAGLFALAIGLVAALMLSASPANAEDEDNYSLYNLSSSVSTYFGNSMSPDKDTKPMSQGWSNVVSNPANGGSVLGYSDPDLSEGLLKWATSSLSGSSGTIGYEMFNNITVEGETSSAEGVAQYAYYGATLQGLGLDSTTTEWSGSMTKMLGGGLIFILFTTSAAADLVFAFALTVLDTLNPFRLFYEGVKAINATFAEGMTGGDGLGGPLAGLGEWIGGWYEVLVGLSWAILVPLMIGMFILGLFMWGQSNRGGRLKKLLIRIVFLGVGLPLLGGVYSATIDAMQDMTAGGSTGATKVVLSTYVDFSSWAQSGRLAVPEDCATIEWDKSAGQPSAESMANVRNTALCINGMSDKYGELTTIIGAGDETSWANEVMKTDDADVVEPGLPGGNTAGSFTNVANVMVLMTNYMSGETVASSNFETAIKGNVSQVVKKTEEDGYEEGIEEGDLTTDKISDWFLNYDNPSDLGKDDLTPSPGSHPMISVPSDSGLRAENKGGTLVFSTAEDTTTGLGFMAVSTNSSTLGEPIGANLSPLAMYNYLNTDFDATGLTTYSSEKVTSGATRESHTAATQVGTGTMSFLYWLNSVVLLAAFTIIGIGYAMVMVFAAIRRMIQMVAAVPFATIGAIPGIAKVIIYSISMILEVVCTAFVYVLVQNVLMSLPQLIEVPLSTFLNDDGGTTGLLAFLISRNSLSMIITLVSIVTIVWFTVLAMRVRKTIMKAIDEAVTKIVDKFMETQIAPPARGSGLGQKMGAAGAAGAGALAGGAGAGLGMAAASNLMGNQGGGGKGKPGSGSGGKGKFGPGGIGSSGVPGGPGSGGGGIGGLAPGVGMAGELGMGPGGNPNDPNSPEGGDGGAGSDGVDLGSTVSGIGGDGRSDRELADEVRAQGGLHGSGDALDSMSKTAEHDAEGYKAKDLKGLEQAGQAGKGAIKAGEAIGRGVGGDYVGAASAGMGALEAGQKVGDMENDKKSIQAGIDGPTPGNDVPGSPGSGAGSDGGGADASSSVGSGEAGSSAGGGIGSGAGAGGDMPAPKVPDAGGAGGVSGGIGSGGSAPTGGSVPSAGGGGGAGAASAAIGAAGAISGKGDAVKGVAGAAGSAGAKPAATGAAASSSAPAPRTQAPSTGGAQQSQSRPAPTPSRGGQPAQTQRRPQGPASTQSAPQRTAQPQQRQAQAGKAQQAAQQQQTRARQAQQQAQARTRQVQQQAQTAQRQAQAKTQQSRAQAQRAQQQGRAQSQKAQQQAQARTQQTRAQAQAAQNRQTAKSRQMADQAKRKATEQRQRSLREQRRLTAERRRNRSKGTGK